MWKTVGLWIAKTLTEAALEKLKPLLGIVEPLQKAFEAVESMRRGDAIRNVIAFS